MKTKSCLGYVGDEITSYLVGLLLYTPLGEFRHEPTRDLWEHYCHLQMLGAFWLQDGDLTWNLFCSNGDTQQHPTSSNISGSSLVPQKQRPPGLLHFQ